MRVDSINIMLSFLSNKVLSTETYLSNHTENFVYYARNCQVSAYCLVNKALDG